MHPTEQAIVEAFIAPHRRARWLWALASPARRHRFLDRLNHGGDLDQRSISLLPSNTDVVALLKSHGAPGTCYLISAASSLDGLVMPLAAAIDAVETAAWGTILSCIPGTLGYYHDECGERRFLLTRPESRT